jgi:hypothetical protein
MKNRRWDLLGRNQSLGTSPGKMLSYTLFSPLVLAGHHVVNSLFHITHFHDTLPNLRTKAMGPTNFGTTL